MKFLSRLSFVFIIFASINCGYNTMQSNEEGVFKAWADVESSLQRRADLIPNLVSTVKGYAKHEKETLQAVIEARSKATSVQVDPSKLSDPAAMKQMAKAQSALSQGLGRLMLIVERYPDLKANQNFRDLQVSLEGAENRINVARQRYNGAVKDFNYSIRKFPNSTINSMFLDLKAKEYYKADEAAKEVPKVEF